ncbi:MAG: YraN family protein [Solirubrobacteraceae bacterium]
MSNVTPTIALGRAGERLAVHHYEMLGAKVLDRNYRTRSGELDLVVAQRGAIVFVEVKTRTAGGMHPFDSLTYAKRTRLRMLAASWLAEHPHRATELRFDAVGIVMTHAGQLISLEQCEIPI